MAGAMINGGNAKKYANYARMSGVVLLVAAGGLWALDIPGMQGLPQPPAAAPAPTAQAKPEQKQQALEAEQLTDAASRLEVAWVPAEKPSAPTPEADPEPDPEPTGPEWAYLGPIKEANRCLAMVSIDGTQRILAVGRVLGDTKLVDADDQKIVVETSGARREIQKSQRSGPTVAWLRGMPTNTPMANQGGAPIPGQAGQMSPEVIQRLRERGIDPSQAQRFREGGGNGRNRGQPNGRNGAGGNGAASFGGVNGAAGVAGQRARAVNATGADADAARAETAN